MRIVLVDGGPKISPLDCWVSLAQAADFYVSAFQDNPRFGISDWQQDTSDTSRDTAAEAVVSLGPASLPKFFCSRWRVGEISVVVGFWKITWDYSG